MAKVARNKSNILVHPSLKWRLPFLVTAVTIVLLLHHIKTYVVVRPSVATVDIPIHDPYEETPPNDSSIGTLPQDLYEETLNNLSVETPPQDLYEGTSTVETPPQETSLQDLYEGPPPPNDLFVESSPQDSHEETPHNDLSVEITPPNDSSAETPPQDPYEEAIKHFSPFASEYSLATCFNLPNRVKRKSFKAYGPPGRELSIFHWRYLTYQIADTVDWKKRSAELCPYPPELVPFFKRFYNKFVKGRTPIVSAWPIGYAPCFLWYLFHESVRGTCKNGQSYHLHFNYTIWRETDVIFIDYPFYFKQEEAPFFDITQMPPRRSNQTWWMSFPEEGLGYYPFAGLDTFWGVFDLTMGSPDNIFDIYKPTYPVENIDPFYDTHVKFENKRNDVLFVWIAGNCYVPNKREDYVRELMNHVTVHSYGNCLHNQDASDEILKKYGLEKGPAPGYWKKHMYEINRDILSAYKFVLVFENSNCEGYVTEKVYNALLVDAIPIYMGASDIDDYVPPGSVIKVTDYESTSALAEHVERIANNKTLYESYFAWKKDTTHENFCKKCHPLDDSDVCAFLERVEWI
ncbi:5795_t:CDS:1 [Paraglomus occultum]|uniref:Fucosyltransferase n=1 Tax=Paraglomus occultum TaxID=144539 RepID=A0A9N9AES3_9GLOM|nr:5795_t:CDS:1 [Paraglomus occultum]